MKIYQYQLLKLDSAGKIQKLSENATFLTAEYFKQMYIKKLILKANFIFFYVEKLLISL